MRQKSVPARLQIILWKTNTGILDVELAWPWLVSLVVSVIGLLMLARDTK
jgi:hypothetical protein